MVDALGDMLADPDRDYRAERDALLDDIENDDAIPGHLWPRLLDTVGALGEEPHGLAASVAFLKHVVRFGAHVFVMPDHTQLSMDTPDPDDPIVCPCGTSVPAVDAHNYGRPYRFGRCPGCGGDVVLVPRRTGPDAVG